MATQSLVICSDPEILGVLGPLMDEVGMEVDVCPEMPGALTSLSRNKYDTVIVDCDQADGGFELLAKLRHSDSHYKMVAVGITSDPAATQTAFESGATFVLNKPLPVEDARRILRITNSAVTRAVRRFMRLPIESLTVVMMDERHEAVLLNLSQRGMAIQASETLAVSKIVYVSFLVPETNMLVEGVAQVVWVDQSGRAGLQFRSMEDRSQEELTRWIVEKVRRQRAGSHGQEEPIEVVEEPVTVKPATDEQLPFASPWHALGVDVMVVCGGILLFFGFVVLAGLFLNATAMLTLAATTGISFWTAYRLLFKMFSNESPDEKAERIHQS